MAEWLNNYVDIVALFLVYLPVASFGMVSYVSYSFDGCGLGLWLRQ
ncbi:hypothetical protein [Salinithrix halophila]|uniref:Uncharacterized protein n=1 Tax=Salinithrix halophila TaxID=1485204 RepID=A0ABV8JEU2_9BACL